MKIPIRKDLYDIADRLKEINKNYDLVFNTDNQKFEVEVKGKTQVVIPFENLDERTLRHVYYTRSENVFNLLDDLERENKNAEKEHLKRAMDTVEDEFSHVARLMNL